MLRSLSADQISAYAEHGYVIVRKLFGPSALGRFDERFRALVSREVPTPAAMLVMRDVMVAKGAVQPQTAEDAIAKIQDLHEDPLFFEEYVRNPQLLDRVESLLGPDLKAVHTMLINKPPRVDGRHPLHQDLLYFPFRPADRIVAAWTAIDHCTRENGCLVAVPGTHRGALLEHRNPEWEWLNRGYFGAMGFGEKTERVHLEMEPGDTVFFHPLLVHGSGRNRTEHYRRSISAHYADARCRYLAEPQVVRPGTRPYRCVRGREHPGCI